MNTRSISMNGKRPGSIQDICIDPKHLANHKLRRNWVAESKYAKLHGIHLTASANSRLVVKAPSASRAGKRKHTIRQ